MRTPRSDAWQRFAIIANVVLPSLIAGKISSSIADLMASVSGIDAGLFEELDRRGEILGVFEKCSEKDEHVTLLGSPALSHLRVVEVTEILSWNWISRQSLEECLQPLLLGNREMERLDFFRSA
jgi:hypothetical protein